MIFHNRDIRKVFLNRDLACEFSNWSDVYMLEKDKKRVISLNQEIFNSLYLYHIDHI